MDYLQYEIDDEPIGESTGFKTGLLMPDPDVACEMPVYEDVSENVLSDADIHDLATMPNRVASRVIFKDPKWMKKGAQRQHSSCNGWAGASAVAKIAVFSGWKDQEPLSGSYVYSWINGNVDEGSTLVDGMRELATHGAPLADHCDANHIYRNQTKQFDAEAANYKGIDMYSLRTKQGFRSALARRHMVVVALQVGGKFVQFRGQGLAPLANGRGNHAVHCDDIIFLPSGQEVYDTCNNWDWIWGYEGRCYTVWDHFAQTFGTHKFYAITGIRRAA